MKQEVQKLQGKNVKNGKKCFAGEAIICVRFGRGVNMGNIENMGGFCDPQSQLHPGRQTTNLQIKKRGR
jgi:hypothetical protein